MNLIRRFKEKYNVISKPVKASIWFVICYVIQRGLQFLSMPIFTRIMSQEEYGAYSVFLSWFNVICIFTSLNIYSGTFNKAMIKHENTRKQYISSVQVLTTLTTLTFSVVLWIMKETIIKITDFNEITLLLLVIHLLFFPTFQYWSQELRFRYEYKPLVIVTILNSFINIFLGIFVVLISSDKSTSLISVVVSVQAIICIFLYISIQRRGKCIYSKEYWSWSLGLALPLIPHYLSEILLGHSDRLMISQMCGTAQAGIYNIVYQISMVMTIVRTGINGAFAPWLYYSIKNSNYKDIKQVIKMLSIMMFLMSILFMFIGPEILKIAAPASYYEAVIDIPAIMAGGFFIFVYVIFVYIETYYEEKNYVSIASISATILNIILNWMLISRYGYLVAGYTTMISYLMMAVMHAIFLKKISLKHPEVRSFIDYKFLFGLSMILMAIGFIALKLYDYLIVRYVLIIVLVSAAFIKREAFISTIKDMKQK